MSGIVIVVAVGVFVASIVAFAATVLMPGADSSKTEDRLAELATRRRGGGKATEEEGGSLLMAGGLDDSTDIIAKMLSGMPKIQDYLDQAGVTMPPAKFAFLCLVCFGFGIFLCVVSPVPVLIAPVLGLAFSALPIGWLLFKRKKRLQKFGCQIPEALELLGRSLRAGHSLNAGFGLVASEMQDPLAREFGRCFEEQNLGFRLKKRSRIWPVACPTWTCGSLQLPLFCSVKRVVTCQKSWTKSDTWYVNDFRFWGKSKHSPAKAE